MIGLAKMAWILANQRVWGQPASRDWPNISRPVDASFPAHEEYYAICDRIARGEKP